MKLVSIFPLWILRIWNCPKRFAVVSNVRRGFPKPSRSLSLLENVTVSSTRPKFVSTPACKQPVRSFLHSALPRQVCMMWDSRNWLNLSFQRFRDNLVLQYKEIKYISLKMWQVKVLTFFPAWNRILVVTLSGFFTYTMLLVYGRQQWIGREYMTRCTQLT